MNGKLILSAILFVDLAALTVVALVDGGNLAAVYEWLTANPWGWQIFADLAIAVGFGMTWIYRDAKRKGLNPYPYMAACLPLGSLGLLAYAIRRSFHRAEAPSVAAAATQTPA